MVSISISKTLINFWYSMYPRSVSNKRVLRDNFNSLPLEIILEILSRIPGESVLACKSVCRNWRDIVSHPSFSKMFFHHHQLSHSTDGSGKLGFLAMTNDGLWTADKMFYYVEYNENDDESTAPAERITRITFTPPFQSYYRFIGSCNGLICLTQRLSVCICNLITKEYVMLPEIEGDWPDFHDKGIFWITGFCYVSSTNEYKVLRIYMMAKPWKVHIYTLGSGNGWRKLRAAYSDVSLFHLNDTGVIANGALYWMVHELKMIGTFDFVEEKFCEYLSAPPLPPRSDWFDCHIGVLDGSLYFVSDLDAKGDKGKDIWLLKTKNDDNGMKERDDHHSLGWSKEFKVDKSRLLCVAKTHGAFNLHCYYINSYDTTTSILKRHVDLKERNCRVIPHKNTLVSLKELGEQDIKTMESVQ